MFRSAKYSLLVSAGLLLAGVGSILVALPAAALVVSTQATPGPGSTAAPGKNLLGTVTAAAADSLTIKLESGSEATIVISPQTRLFRTAPGEKTLKGATAIHLEDLATGDRVLVMRATPGADATHYNAVAVVTMKQADITQAHATQSEDWQRRGVGGIVKSVEPSSADAPGTGATPAATTAAATGAGATIVVGTAQAGRTLAIHTTPATTIRRYAPDSVDFADAKIATLAEIHPGDQLRARGDRNADGTEETAVEIVFGSFRNVAGTITAIDTAQNTVTVTDLATKRPVTLKLTAETQMRKLPPEMAQRLTARTEQGGSRQGSRQGSGQGSAEGARPANAAGSGATPPADAASHPSIAQAGGEPGARQGPGGRRMDPGRMLQSAPPVTLAELKKGDAIMVVAARGGGGLSDAATAITLIAGVEPLLESPSGAASQSLFSASWNLSGGGEAPAQ